MWAKCIFERVKSQSRLIYSSRACRKPQKIEILNIWDNPPQFPHSLSLSRCPCFLYFCLFASDMKNIMVQRATRFELNTINMNMLETYILTHGKKSHAALQVAVQINSLENGVP